MLVQKATTSVYRGVSQQDKSNRLEGQVSESINMLHSVERGVSRRNPTEFVGLLNGVSSNSFIHTYARGDGTEEYIISIDNTTGTISVFDTNGTKKTVNSNVDVATYLQQGIQGIDTYKALTVGDTTFILNKNVVSTMSTIIDGVQDAHKLHPFYWVKRSFDNGAGVGYKYYLNGQTATGTETTDIANSLVTALGVNFKRFGSIVVSKLKPTKWTWSDSYGSLASEGFWGVADKVTDLPNTMSGAESEYDFIVEIQGDPDNSYNNFWVKYTNDHWKETVKPYLKNRINNKTMPIKLTRIANGTFLAELIDYSPRTVGDEITAVEPSFIGKRISDMFFFKNRFCLLANENVIMSETGAFYNFFPTTVTDVLDSDPIDVSVDSNTVSLLHHAVPFDNKVILLSKEAQFSLQADKVISPNDVSIPNTTNYNTLTNVSPVSLGNSLFFLSDSLKGISLREYYVSTESNSNVAVDVSGHASEYIPSNASKVVGNTNQDIIFIISPDTADTIYVYKFYNDGKDRIQTAWFKWVFSGSISNISILGNYLYILIDRGNGVQLEKLDYSNNSLVTSFKDNGAINYLSAIELSELVLKDREGKTIENARSPLLYKTFQLTSKEGSTYKVNIHNSINDRVVERFALKDNKFLVQGKTSDLSISIQSVDDKLLEFHTYTFEVNYNPRSKLI